jgi:IclR family transcriptional regulator, acetate operon repressor
MYRRMRTIVWHKSLLRDRRFAVMGGFLKWFVSFFDKMAVMPRKEDKIPATLRAIGVLEALVADDRRAALGEIARHARLPKPTTYRMLAMLEGAGLVAREPADRSFVPGPRLVTLARNALLNSGQRAPRHAILARLVGEIGETCNFTMLDGAQVVYLDRVETAWPLRMSLSSGSRVPLHCTASGKLLLALQPGKVRDRLLASIALERLTEHTITNRKRLETELARIRGRKYSTDNEEYHTGLVCVAVPVLDARRRACAAIAVHAPVSRMSLERALDHLPVLRRAADEMARTFGE